MASVWVVRLKDGTTKYIEAAKCKSADEAATRSGCKAGYTCFVNTVFTPPDMTAAEWIAQQKKTAAPTPTPVTPTPTTPTPTTPTPTTPTPTMPTPTMPTPTTPTTPTAGASGSDETIRQRLEQQAADYGKQIKKTLTVEQYLDLLMQGKGGATITQKAKDSLLAAYNRAVDAATTMQEWQPSYEIYLEYLKTPAGKGLPTPRDLNDYIAHAVEWNDLASKLQYEPQREYNTYMYWSSLMKTPDDWWPTNVDDFYANYDKAQQQLTAWQQEYETSAKGVEPEKQREYDDFRRYASAYGEPGDWYPTSIEDYFANTDTAQGQLSAWKKMAGEAEQYQLSPEEAARRREESYGESRYAAKERYRETPEYQPPYAQWLKDAEQFSGAMQEYAERQYSSLVSQFKATQPKLTGYASREAARAGATQREEAFQAWLPEQTPELEQKYWSQRPAERGERPYMYSPAMVAKNW